MPPGGRVLRREQIEQVEGLLAAGLSQRAAARRLGIARGTVATVARGLHRLQRDPARAASARPADKPTGRRIRAEDVEGLKRRLAEGGRLGAQTVRRLLRAAGQILQARPLGVRLRGSALTRYRAVARKRRAVERRLGNRGRRVDVARAPRDAKDSIAGRPCLIPSASPDGRPASLLPAPPDCPGPAWPGVERIEPPAAACSSPVEAAGPRNETVNTS